MKLSPLVPLLLLALFCLPLSALAVESVEVEEMLYTRIAENESQLAAQAEDAEALRILAQSHERLSHWSLALDYYRRLLELEPENKVAQRGCARLEKLLRWRATLRWEKGREREFWAEMQVDDNTLNESRWQLALSRPFAADAEAGFAFEQGDVEQRSDIYQSQDYALDSTGLSLFANLPVGRRLLGSGRVALHRYEEHDSNSYFRLNEAMTLLTGELSLSWVTRSNVSLTLFANRSRDILPRYDALSGTAWLEVRGSETLGGALTLNPVARWQLRGGLYHSSATSDDPAVTVLHGETTWFTPLRGLDLSLAAERHSDDNETIASTALLYRPTPRARLDPTLACRLAYSDVEKSWKESLRLALNYKLDDRWSLGGEVSYARESGDDQDEQLRLQLALTTRF